MKTPINIDNLRVASPCPVSWNDMAGDERARFCHQCQLKVYDIAELTRGQAEELLGIGGRICGRLYRRADGTVLTKDCPVGLQALRRRITRRAAAVFATLLGLSAAVWAQQPAVKECRPQIRIAKVDHPGSERATLSGTIFDPNDAGLPFASIVIENSVTKEQTKLFTREDGRYSSGPLTEGTYSLTIEGDFFKKMTVREIQLKKDSLTVDVTVEPSDGPLMGIIAISQPLPPPGTFTMSGDLLTRLPH